MHIAKHLSRVQPSYIREILNAATKDSIISLAGGLPAKEHFPMELLADPLKRLAMQPELFQYGETPGYRPLLDYLAESYQLPDTHATLVCNGSQQAIDLVARTFINPGDRVVVEAPSYLGALQAFYLSQATIESVEQIVDGPDLNILESLFASQQIKFFYAVPDFHNPTGICWSLQVRKHVAELCERYHVVLIEDVPYRELRFSGELLPLASSFCPEQSIVLRSFSKMASPGIRLGMLTGPKDWVNSIIRVKQASDLHTNLPMQSILLALLKHGNFSAHIRSLRKIYYERYRSLTGALLDHLGDTCSYSPVEGGMFVWLKLPNCNPVEVASMALKEGVAVVPSSVFYDDQSCAQPALRLNFSHAKAELFPCAVVRLGRAIKSCIGS